MVKRASWLSVTPEPERELPGAVATLTRGTRPPAHAIAEEQARIEHLILHGSERQWLAYLHGVVELIDATAQMSDPEVVRARERARTVIFNHHNLLLGLPGRAAERTAADRARLARLPQPTTAKDAHEHNGLPGNHE
ncbi:MAG TPA: hypothetical protein VMU39_18355 [Solirubrobacteraceae bacterium]|nr:hypothetical protein [Solirubrobacteraceae bacterium]